MFVCLCLSLHRLMVKVNWNNYVPQFFFYKVILFMFCNATVHLCIKFLFIFYISVCLSLTVKCQQFILGSIWSLKCYSNWVSAVWSRRYSAAHDLSSKPYIVMAVGCFTIGCYLVFIFEAVNALNYFYALLLHTITLS